MTKHHGSGQLLVITMLPVLQGHEMTRDMQEGLRPKRKKKRGGPIPGYRSGGRADRRPRQAWGAILRALGAGTAEAAEEEAPEMLKYAIASHAG
jgi:hypothetical protein